MGWCRRPETWSNKTTSDRWNSNWSHGSPHQFPEEKGETHWEKEFCKTNGVDWERLLKAKRFLRKYPKIINWDDSAGKEAFENAKARYWAHINGHDELETPLPNPDLFTDPIDHPEATKEEEVSVGMSTRWTEVADCLDLSWGVEPTCSWADIPQITSNKIIATGWVACA